MSLIDKIVCQKKKNTNYTIEICFKNCILKTLNSNVRFVLLSETVLRLLNDCLNCLKCNVYNKDWI